MGWFLTRNKKRKTRRTNKRGSILAPANWDPQRTLLGLKVLGTVTLVLALATGWHYSELALRRYASARPAPSLSLSGPTVEFLDLPPWISPSVVRQVSSRVAEVAGHDPLGGAPLQRAARALEQEPWVRQVHQVRRLADGRIQVEVDFREPAAVVESHLGYLLVDTQNVRLPGIYLRHQVELLDLPLLTGVLDLPPEQPGMTWLGGDLEAGLALVRLLAPEPYIDQVRAFHVSRTDLGRRRLTLLTDRGEVHWGYPPGKEHTVEPDWQVKLTRLRRLHEQYQAIDAGRPVVEIYGAAVQASTGPSLLGGVRTRYTSTQ